jgi:thioredoxin reductase
MVTSAVAREAGASAIPGTGSDIPSGVPVIDVAIIGAGPYGLSIAAHLSKRNIPLRIFGTPMASWRSQMPKGMFLKSDGFASSLSDPDASFTIGQYCLEHGVSYKDVGIPVAIQTFVDYGLEFQKRFVPELEQTDIVSVSRVPEGFELLTQRGESFKAKTVVVAAGITHFSYLPPVFAELQGDVLTHSSQHNELSSFRGRKVAVIGAGASAVDIAGLLHQAGAEVHLVARRQAIQFHEPPVEFRSLWQKISNPRSGLGLGWRSWLSTETPLVFHTLPEKLRIRAVKSHLGPAPGWFARDGVVGKVTMHLGTTLRGASASEGGISLKFTTKDGVYEELQVDHVIAATGYRVEIDRLQFLDEKLRDQIESVEDTPILSRNFESSVPGLYVVGLASAVSFGPLARFAHGAKFTARHISKHLAAILK